MPQEQSFNFANSTVIGHKHVCHHDSDHIESISTFQDLNLSEPLLQAIIDDGESLRTPLLPSLRHETGILQPSAVQRCFLPAILSGRDTSLASYSCHGRTFGAIIAALQTIDPSLQQPQVLYLCATRELAMSATRTATRLSAQLQIQVQAMLGGTHVRQTIEQLRSNPQLIVGTVGRTLDMTVRGFLAPENIKLVVLDEADEILTRGFEEQLHDLRKLLPATVQVVTFGGYFQRPMEESLMKLMHNPIALRLTPNYHVLDSVKQFVLQVDDPEHKSEAFCVGLASWLPVAGCVVFVRSDERAAELTSHANAVGLEMTPILQAMPQDERALLWEALRRGIRRVLVSTDECAETIEEGIWLVVNFDMPRNVTLYYSRVGARQHSGRTVVAVSLVTKDDAEILKAIEDNIKSSIPVLPAEVPPFVYVRRMLSK